MSWLINFLNSSECNFTEVFGWLLWDLQMIVIFNQTAQNFFLCCFTTKWQFSRSFTQVHHQYKQERQYWQGNHVSEGRFYNVMSVSAYVLIFFFSTHCCAGAWTARTVWSMLSISCGVYQSLCKQTYADYFACCWKLQAHLLPMWTTYLLMRRKLWWVWLNDWKY